jgi:DnaK suppressor protein
MNTKLREVFRGKLLELRARLGADVNVAEAEALRGASPSVGDRADVSCEASEEEINVALLDNEEYLLREVEAALERLETGRFGRCEGCGRRIAEARLRATPYARTCRRCATE